MRDYILVCISLFLCLGCSTSTQQENQPVQQQGQKKPPLAAKEALPKQEAKVPIVAKVAPKQEAKVAGIKAADEKELPQQQVGKQEEQVPQQVGKSAEDKMSKPPLADFEKKMAQEKIRAEQESWLIKNYLTTAQNCANSGKYEEAYQFISEILHISPDHPEALRLKNLYGSRLGYRPDEIGEQLRGVQDLARVKIEQTQMEIDNKIAQGKRLFKDKQYQQAMTALKQAKEILRWMPYHVRELDGKIRQVDLLIQNTEKEYSQQEEDLKSKRMAESEEEAKRQERARLKTLQEQIQVLFREANLAFEKERYELADNFCKQIERLDATNKEVEPLRNLIREARHTKVMGDIRDKYLEEWRKVFERVEQNFLFQTEIITWPSYEEWKKITKRATKGGEQKTAEESPESRKLRERLEEEISMDFSESPLNEVVEFIRNRTGINMIIDPSVYKDFPDPQSLQIDIAVNNLKLTSLLNVILDMKGLAYRIDTGGVLVISTKKRVEETPLLRLYNVRDLTGKLNDFPGVELSLAESKGNELGGVQMKSEDEKPATTITEEQLTDLIKNNIAKGTWETPNRSIDTRSGTLIIRQTKEVHEQIDSLLNDLRKATGLLVTVEARFITVADNFLEDVGVDWRSLGASAYSIPEISETDATNGLKANEIGTGHNYTTLDDALLGQTLGTSGIGTGRSAGFYWNKNGSFSTKQRVENLFDQTLGHGLFTNSGGLAMQFAYIDDIECQAILQAVRKRSRSNVVVAPRLTVFNTQRANVSLLKQEAYVRDYDVQVATAATIADPVIGTIQEGVVLDVRPIISADRKYITLELQPTVGEIKSMTTFPTTLASSAGAVGNVQIQLPTLRMTKLKTTVTVPDGGTLLLGGVNEGDYQDYMSGIPILSDIPILNALFTRRGQYTRRQSLLILVSAKITSLEETEPKEGPNQ